MTRKFIAFILAILIFVQIFSIFLYAKSTFDDKKIELDLNYINDKDRYAKEQGMNSLDTKLEFYIKDDHLFVDGESFLSFLKYDVYLEDGSLFFATKRTGDVAYPNLLRNGNFYKNKKTFELAYNDPGSITINIPVAPFEKDGKFWIPFQFICDALSIDLQANPGVISIKTKSTSIDDLFNEALSYLSFPIFNNIDDIIDNSDGVEGLNTFFVTYLNRFLDRDYIDAFNWDHSMLRDVFKTMFLYDKMTMVDEIKKNIEAVNKYIVKPGKEVNKYDDLTDYKEVIDNYIFAIESGKYYNIGDDIYDSFSESSVKYLYECKQLENHNVDKIIAGLDLINIICKDVLIAAYDISNFDQEIVQGMRLYFNKKSEESPEIAIYREAEKVLNTGDLLNHAMDSLPSVIKFEKSSKKLMAPLKFTYDFGQIISKMSKLVLEMTEDTTKYVFSNQIDSAENYQISQYSGFISESFRLDFINAYYDSKKDGFIEKEKIDELKSLMYLSLIAKHTNNTYMSNALKSFNYEDSKKIVDYLKEDNEKIDKLVKAIKSIKDDADYKDEDLVIERILRDKNFAKLYNKNYNDFDIISIILAGKGESALSDIFKKGDEKIESKEDNGELSEDEKTEMYEGTRIVLMLDLSAMYPPEYEYQDYYDFEVNLGKLVDKFLFENPNNAFTLVTNEISGESFDAYLESDNNSDLYSYEPFDMINQLGRRSDYFMQGYNKFENRKFISFDPGEYSPIKYFTALNDPNFINRKSGKLKEIEIYVGNYFVETEDPEINVSPEKINLIINRVREEYSKYASGKSTYSMHAEDEFTDFLKDSKFKYSEDLVKSLQNSGYRVIRDSDGIMKFLEEIIKNEAGKNSPVNDSEKDKKKLVFGSYSDSDFIDYASKNMSYDPDNDKIFVDDYDGDGKREAYVCVGVQDEIYKIYFINRNLEAIDISTDVPEEISAGFGLPKGLIKAGKDKYLVFIENAGGPGSNSYVMSADGYNPYFPSINGQITLFYQDGGKFYNSYTYLEESFDDQGNSTGGVRKEAIFEYIYDERSREFIKK